MQVFERAMQTDLVRTALDSAVPRDRGNARAPLQNVPANRNINTNTGPNAAAAAASSSFPAAATSSSSSSFSVAPQQPGNVSLTVIFALEDDGQRHVALAGSSASDEHRQLDEKKLIELAVFVGPNELLILISLSTKRPSIPSWSIPSWSPSCRC